MVIYIPGFPFDWILIRKFLDGSMEDKEYKLECGETTIGRGMTNKIVCSSNVASRLHCIVFVDTQGTICVKDLNSTNGTFVGSDRIIPSQYSQLSDNDTIGIGGHHQAEDDECYVFKVIKRQHDVSEVEHPTNDNTEQISNMTLNGSSSHTNSCIDNIVSKKPIIVEAIPSTSEVTLNPNLGSSLPYRLEIVSISDSDSDVVDIKKEANVSRNVSKSENETLKLNKSSVPTTVETNSNMVCEVSSCTNVVERNKETLNHLPVSKDNDINCDVHEQVDVKPPSKHVTSNITINPDLKTKIASNNSTSSSSKKEHKEKKQPIFNNIPTLGNTNTNNDLPACSKTNRDCNNDNNEIDHDKLGKQGSFMLENGSNNHINSSTLKNDCSIREGKNKLKTNIKSEKNNSNTIAVKNDNDHNSNIPLPNQPHNAQNFIESACHNHSDRAEHKKLLFEKDCEKTKLVVNNNSSLKACELLNSTSKTSDKSQCQIKKVGNTTRQTPGEVDNLENKNAQNRKKKEDVDPESDRDPKILKYIHHPQTHCQDTLITKESEINNRATLADKVCSDGLKNIKIHDSVSLEKPGSSSSGNVVNHRRDSSVETTTNENIPRTSIIGGSHDNLRESTSIVSESFTLDDDDIIIINDDEEFPCSQRLDIKQEASYDNVESLIDYHCNNDDYEGSDDDSSDEWFQKLSQCPYEEENVQIVDRAEPEDIEKEDKHERTEEDEEINKILIKDVISESKRKLIDITEDDDNQVELTSKKKIMLPNEFSHQQYINEEMASDKDELLIRSQIPEGKRKLYEISDEENDDKEIDNDSEKLIEQRKKTDDESLFRKRASGNKRKLPDTSDEEEVQNKINHYRHKSEVLKKHSKPENEKYKSKTVKRKNTCSTKHKFKTKMTTETRSSSIDSEQSSSSSKSEVTKNEVHKISIDSNHPGGIVKSKLIQAGILLALHEKYDEPQVMTSKNQITPLETSFAKDTVDFEDQITSIAIDKPFKNPSGADDILKITRTSPVVSERSDNNKMSEMKNHDKLDICHDHTKADLELPLTNSQKLLVVNKKISETYKKSPIEIIDAKKLPIRRKKVENAESNLNKNKDKAPGDKWLSKPLSSKSGQPISKQERKALRKKKLENICKTKETALNTIDDQSKSSTTAKNTTKITQKSRNAMFFDTLVSSDGQERKKENSCNDNSIKSYKIPRRQSKSDKSPLATAISSTLTEPSVSNTNTSTKDQLEAYNKQSKFTEKKVANNNDCTTLINQILTSKTSNSDSNVIPVNSLTTSKKVVFGVENEEPFKVKYISGHPNQFAAVASTLRPILKMPISRLPICKGIKKKVKFCPPGQDNIYVFVREIEIGEDAVLRPLTKNVTRKEPPPKRKIELKNLIYTKYTDETLYQICKWNYLWFEESERVKGEPPLYTGQVYQLRESFNSYQDYRHTMLPLLLYELWQSVSKQYCQIKNRNKSIKIVIRRVFPSPLKNQTIPLQRANEQRVLSRLECQAVLEKETRGDWPRQGDLLMLDLPHPDKKIEKSRKVIAYLMSSNVRSLKLHKDVSLNLVQATPKASQVMDFTLFIRESHPIDNEQEAFIYVLKNIKPELRQFDALDCLASSPLLSIILNPKENNIPVPQVDVIKSAYRQTAHLNPVQKKAVVTVAKTIAETQNMIQFIHGPPGCGKSEVIIGIILQLWNAWHHKEIRGCPQILLCAPSNAAIDDIFLRLMNIRQNITNMPKFNMVRIGRTDMTHKNVSSLTLDSIVEKEMKKNSSILEDSEMKAVELGRLEAKKNLLVFQRENPGKYKENIEYMKDLERKYAEVLENIKELERGTCKPVFEGKEWRERKKELESTVLEKANIIATTLSSCYNAQMEQAYTNKRLNFTCCIVDEATQCTEPETLIPLMLGVNSLVLVGDPKQLPATVLSEKAKSCGLQHSLFVRQWRWWKLQKQFGNSETAFNSRYHFLTIQYRMHPAILNWPSHYFYEDHVVSHRTLQQEREKCSLVPYLVLSHDYQQSASEDSNYDEARMVVNLVNGIVKSKTCDGMSIGIITGYNKQKDQIKRRIDSVNKMLGDIEIGTVDSYQGRERDIILLSCVRTDGVGFLTDTRLNVAVTRARYSLIICGNFITLQKDPTWASLIENARKRGLFKVYKYDPNRSILQDIIKPTIHSVTKKTDVI